MAYDNHYSITKEELRIPFAPETNNNAAEFWLGYL